VLYWQLTALGVPCTVVAPTLVPMKAGDRVKTDRRDALKLARCHGAGALTAVWVLDAAHEALRDLVRARESAKKDQLRARQRLAGMNAWTQRHRAWLKTVHFSQAAQEATVVDYLHEVEHMADRIMRLETAIDQAVEQVPTPMRAVIDGLQALRGVALISAVTIVAELGQLSRFPTARELMGYSGAVPREHTTGSRVRRGGITKTGNAHLRRVVGEAAWAYRYRPAVGPALRKRQAAVGADVTAIAWKAQHRLHARYRHLLGRGKSKQAVVTAVGRELLGFIWAIGVTIEAAEGQASPVAT
jgi:transposase